MATTGSESVIEVAPTGDGRNLVSINESLLDLESWTSANFPGEIVYTAQAETPAAWAGVSGSDPSVTGLASNEETFTLTITEPCSSRPIALDASVSLPLSVATAVGTVHAESEGRGSVSSASGAAMSEID